MWLNAIPDQNSDESSNKEDTLLESSEQSTSNRPIPFIFNNVS